MSNSLELKKRNSHIRITVSWRYMTYGLVWYIEFKFKIKF